MVANLVKRLRTCPKEERRAFAIELAKMRTDKSIAELVKMVKARHRVGLKWYNLDDQLIGVEALGETQNNEILSYLRRLYTPQVTIECREYHVAQGISDSRDEYWKVEVYRYPNVPSELAQVLKYEVSLTICSDYGSESGIPEDQIEQDRKDTLAKMKPHQIFREAIAKLESSTQHHA